MPQHTDDFEYVPPDVLTAKMLAERLHLNEQTVRTLASAGKIPGRKIGEAKAAEWRFFWPQVIRTLFGEGNNHSGANNAEDP